MKKAVLIFLLFYLANLADGQIFYLQSFPDDNFPAGWSTNNSRVVPNNNAASSGYNPPPASGGYNIRMQDCLPLDETVQLTVSGVISTVGRTGIRVGFGRRRSNAHATPIAFAWSSDGVNWTTISSNVAPSASDAWDAVFFDLSTAAENVSNLRFRFSYVTQVNMNCTTPPNFRIDDFAVGENFSLPMELLCFEARAEGSQVRLNWTTAVEYSSAHFEVERGGSDGRFESIGRVVALGYARQEHQYEFVDTAPWPGLNYYRLRLSDADGAFSYSPIRQVHVLYSSSKLRVFPSPARDFLHVVVAAPMPERTVVRWRILDVPGRSWSEGIVTDGIDWEIPVRELPAGIYWLQCDLGRERLVQPFFIQ